MRIDFFFLFLNHPTLLLPIMLLVGWFLLASAVVFNHPTFAEWRKIVSPYPHFRRYSYDDQVLEVQSCIGESNGGSVWIHHKIPGIYRLTFSANAFANVVLRSEITLGYIGEQSDIIDITDMNQDGDIRGTRINNDHPIVSSRVISFAPQTKRSIIEVWGSQTHYALDIQHLANIEFRPIGFRYTIGRLVMRHISMPLRAEDVQQPGLSVEELNQHTDLYP